MSFKIQQREEYTVGAQMTAGAFGRSLPGSDFATRVDKNTETERLAHYLEWSGSRKQRQTCFLEVGGSTPSQTVVCDDAPLGPHYFL